MAALFCWLMIDYSASEVVRVRCDDNCMNLVSSSIECTRVAAIVEPPLQAMGLVLVRVDSTAGQHRTVQIMIERADGVAITLDACAAASRSISALLDVEDPIAGSYELEVGSPGIERPLTRAQDFDRFAGHNAKIVFKAPQAGHRRLLARLVGLVDGGYVRLAGDGEDLTVPLEAIEKARLVAEDKRGKRRPVQPRRLGR